MHESHKVKSEGVAFFHPRHGDIACDTYWCEVCTASWSDDPSKCFGDLDAPCPGTPPRPMQQLSHILEGELPSANGADRGFCPLNDPAHADCGPSCKQVEEET